MIDIIPDSSFSSSDDVSWFFIVHAVIRSAVYRIFEGCVGVKGNWGRGPKLLREAFLYFEVVTYHGSSTFSTP